MALNNIYHNRPNIKIEFPSISRFWRNRKQKKWHSIWKISTVWSFLSFAFTNRNCDNAKQISSISIISTRCFSILACILKETCALWKELNWIKHLGFFHTSGSNWFQGRKIVFIQEHLKSDIWTLNQHLLFAGSSSVGILCILPEWYCWSFGIHH